MFLRGIQEETWLNCVFKNEQDAMSFFDFINSQHPNIKFTFEKQNDGKLSFLDVLINNSSHDCVFSVFHKKTYTGLLTNFFSFTPFRYKIGLIRTLIDRTYKINNTSSGFQNDLIKSSIGDGGFDAFLKNAPKPKAIPYTTFPLNGKLKRT